MAPYRGAHLTTRFDREDVLAQFATLTLGSGAAAAVIGRADRHPEGHPHRRFGVPRGH